MVVWFILGSVNSALGAVKDFVKEPRPVFGFVDPVLDQAGGGNVFVLVTDVVSSAQVLDQLLVVGQQIGQHGLWH